MKHRLTFAGALTTTATVLAALCLTATASATSSLGLVTPETLDPHVTNPDISSGPGSTVWAPRGTAKNKLVVFLPGSATQTIATAPSSYLEFGSREAGRGFDVIGVAYQNMGLLASQCGGFNQDDCYRSARGEVIFGYADRAGEPANRYGTLPGEQPWTNLSGVDTRESVINRLVSVLEFKQLDRYLVRDAGSPYGRGTDRAYPKWSEIIVSGHSQGAGHALFIQKREPVSRAALFSGPSDAVGAFNGQAVSWVSQGNSSATNVALLTHPREGTYCQGCDTNAAAAGISARYSSSYLPGNCANALTCAPVKYHGSTAADDNIAFQPVDPGRPELGVTPSLGPTWDAMVGG